MSVESTESAPGPLPTWLSIPIILVCLAGGGWIIHWYVLTDPISRESKMLGDAPAEPQVARPQPRNRNNNNTPPGRGITQRNGRWDVRTDHASATVSFTAGKTAVINTIIYIGNNPYAFVPQETQKTLMAARALMGAQNRVEAMKFTPAEKSEMDRIANPNPNSRITMAVSSADRLMLANLMAGYQTADPKNRPAMDDNILKTLDEIAERSKPATKQQAIDRARQINTIMTPDRWALNKSMGGVGGN